MSTTDGTGPPLEYVFEMTPDFARAAAGPLERALWLQNERIYQRLRARMPWRPKLRVFGVLLSVSGVALAEIGWAGSRRAGELFLAMAAVFAAFALTFALGPRLEPGLRRVTRRLTAWRARRMMLPVARRAPYSIRYALAGSALSATVESLKLSLQLDLRSVPVAVTTADFVCAFRKPFGSTRVRVLYLPGPAERAALVDALRSCGAAIFEVSP